MKVFVVYNQSRGSPLYSPTSVGIAASKFAHECYPYVVQPLCCKGFSVSWLVYSVKFYHIRSQSVLCVKVDQSKCYLWKS